MTNEELQNWIDSAPITTSLATPNIAKLTSERDELMAARCAYATEFALNEEGQPDVGSIHQNIRVLKAAAKLALNALTEIRDNGFSWDAEYDKAIKALKKAGVK